MSRASPIIRQADLTRLIKGVRAAGVEVAQVVVESGKVVIHVAGSKGKDLTPLDQWRRDEHGQD